jgi:hypothetical protein
MSLAEQHEELMREREALLASLGLDSLKESFQAVQASIKVRHTPSAVQRA